MADTKIGLGPEQQNEDERIAEFMRRSGMNKLLAEADLDAGFSLNAPFKLTHKDIDVIAGPDGLNKLTAGNAMFLPRTIVQAEGEDGKMYSIHMADPGNGVLIPTAYEVREKTNEEQGKILDTRDEIASGLS